VHAARCSQVVFGQLCSMAVAPNASDLQRLRRNDRAMIRWICGAKLEDEISSAVLLPSASYGGTGTYSVPLEVRLYAVLTAVNVISL